MRGSEDRGAHNAKPTQNGYLTIEGQFGKIETIPLGDPFCCENDLLSVLKRKEKGDLYGRIERNRCIQIGPELGLAGNAISIQNEHKATELDRACCTKPTQNRHRFKIISYVVIPIWRLLNERWITELAHASSTKHS